MSSETHTIILSKDQQRAIQERSIRNKVGALINSLETKTITQHGWAFSWDAANLVQSDSKLEDQVYHYELPITVTFNHASNEPGKREFASILYTMYGRAMNVAFGQWTLSHVDGKEYSAPENDSELSSNISKDMVGYAETEIPEDWESYFDHLFGLAPHISRVRSALQAAIASDWNNRFNVALVGPPGCGKSDIARSMKRALGEDSVMEFDATATTAAGIIQQFKEIDILPRVIIIEEIEKAKEDAMQPLLAILDQRGEVRKVTARGAVQRDTRCLVICTVNNYERFKNMQAGALHSRCSNRVFFEHPSRETLALILNREVDKINGNREWVTPALDFCDDHKINDPREVISVCLCGGDGLLDGTFQATMAATAQPESLSDSEMHSLGL